MTYRNMCAPQLQVKVQKCTFNTISFFKPTKMQQQQKRKEEEAKQQELEEIEADGNAVPQNSKEYPGMGPTDLTPEPLLQRRIM
jgi:hypothetical protein